MVNLIRASNLWGFSSLVREFGADPDDLQRRFGIEPGVDHGEEAFIAFAPFVTMLEAAATELGCPDFGMRLSSSQGLDVLGPVAVIARNAQTLQDGLEAIARFLYVHSPALRLTVAPQAGAAGLRFTYEIAELSLPELRQGYELSMANGVRMIRLLGEGAAPSAVSFMHEQVGPDTSYAEALGCPVRFGQSWCGFELPMSVTTRPIDRADPETRRIATMYLESNYLPSDATLPDRVADLARKLMPAGQCSVDAIAHQLAMHPRALQRRLAADGVGCQEVIEHERRRLAAKYLAEPGLHLNQIAGLLGYAEQSTLNRSCRRWFGQTPRQVRAGL